MTDKEKIADAHGLLDIEITRLMPFKKKAVLCG